MNNTAVMAMLSGLKNEDREKSIGYLEVSNGIGILCGPLIGALLYNIGGYHFPFAVFALLYLGMYPVIGHFLFKANSEKNAYMARTGQNSQVSESQNYEKDPITMSMLFSKPRFLFGIWGQLNTMMALQFIAPNISVKLFSLGFDQTLIGVTYGTPSIIYACTCPFIYLLTQKVEKRGIIVIGFFSISIALLMIGGNDYVREYNKETFFILWGLIIIGMSAGMVTIPVLPEMLDAINEDKELIDKYDNEYIQNIISGLFIGFQSIGEAAGPIASQVLITYYGF
jgi:MFS family permease